MSKKAGLTSSFSHAIDGLKTASRQEPNFQIHLAIATISLILGIVLQIEKIEWIILLFTISFVLILELINTMLEALVDIVQPKKHPKAKLAKDVSASAVLVGALVSVVIGILIFLPKIAERYF